MMADRDSEMMIEDDPAAAYRQELANLELNSKPHILMLTMLADDYKDTKASEISDCIEQRLLHVAPDKKLPTLYLIDSICKNLAESSYIDLFQRKIIGLFCHTFERVDDKIRVLLYKLRQTWTEVFTPEVLYSLDMSVKKIDSNWPVAKVAIKSSENIPRNHLEPNKIKIVSPKINANALSNNSDIGKQLLSKQNEFLNLQRQQIELELQNKILNISEINKTSKKFKNDSKRKLSSDQNNGSSKMRKKDTTEKPSKNLSPSRSGSLSKSDKSKSRRKTTQSKSQISPKSSKKSIIEIPVPIPVAPEDVIPLGSSHHISVTKWSKPDPRHRNESMVASIKRRSPSRRRSRSPPPVVSPISSSRNRLSPNKSSNHDSSSAKKTTIQTTIPAPNIFAQPEMIFGFSKIPENPSKLTDSWNSQSGTTNVGFGMDRDYRHEFDSVISDAKNKLNTGAITSADHDVLVREAQRQFCEMQNNQSQFAPNASQFPPHNLPATAAPPGQTSALVEPHGSVVLYINNELRRLYYVDNVTSIVLKAHPDTPFDQLVSFDPVALEPKQVFFSGMPTTVYIDQGTPNEQSIRLEFSDRMAATFYLPGVGIPQRIMLGLPARELIINGRVYQASFGGAGVKIYLECDNDYHEFRLSDSRPLLKFSDEIRYDLWRQLIHDAKMKPGLPVASQSGNFEYTHAPLSAPSTVAAFASQSTTPQLPGQFAPFDRAQVQVTTTSSKDSLFTGPPLPDLSTLLSKLTSVGLLPSNSVGPSSESTSKESSQKRPRKDSAPKRYLSLDVSLLKSSHQYVIDQLYSGVQCTNCSLRFSDDALKDESDSGEKAKKSRYARHLDWHFRQNRREKSKPGSALSSTSAVMAHRRPWYYTIDLWILYKEVNDDIEEDSAGFFDTNTVNSPSMLAASGASFDFSQFKEFISDFDSFIESVNCDNTSVDSSKLCSVVAESDQNANTCAVCNELFDLKWQEEEEEWRLMNAVRYMVNDGESSVRIYHPQCLKDFLIQQEKGVDVNQSSDSRSDNIPALDTSLKEEEEKFSVNTNRNVLIPGFDCDVKTEEPVDSNRLHEENGPVGRDSMEEDNEQSLKDEPNEEDQSTTNLPINKEEDFEVKVFEYEIPIVGLIKNESTELEDAPLEAGILTSFDESTNDSTNVMSPKRTVSAETEQISPNGKTQVNATAQPKRGGIVIKMKKSTALTISSPTTSSPSTETTPESGNVLANRDSAVSESVSSGLESRPEHISSNCDNKGNDVADITDDATAINGLAGDLAISEHEPSGDLSVSNGALLSGQDEAFRPITEDQEQTKRSDDSDSLGPSETERPASINGATTSGGLLSLPPGECSPNVESEPSSTEKPAEENYFSRGHEMSSLCTIM